MAKDSNRLTNQDQEEERSRSGSVASSAHSVQFNMGFPTPLKAKFLGQTIKSNAAILDDELGDSEEAEVEVQSNEMGGDSR